MKKLLLLLLLLPASYSHAQNYQCLQAGVKHYFTNSDGYLRGIRIDSVWTSGDTTLYYPFHTPRAAWTIGLGGLMTTTTVDSNGGCWLGGKVLQLNDGTFVFDNLWGAGDVSIKTFANAGDSWLFYYDSSSFYYTAMVTSVDTMTFLGVLDSVKKITINAYYDSVLNTADSLNGFQVILSKNNGFVQVFDLYTFPYHPKDTVYTRGADMYLDLSTSSQYHVAPNAYSAIYKLVTFINPTDSTLNEANVGDVFEIGIFTSPSAVEGYYQLDTIITKTSLSLRTAYTFSGIQGGYYPISGYNPTSYYGGSDTTNDAYIFDPSIMPEETFPDSYTNVCNYYYPDDTSLCTTSPAYRTGWIFGDNGTIFINKSGFGQTDYIYETGDPWYQENKLIYADKSNTSCGSFYFIPPLSTPTINNTTTLTLSPNPVTTTLSIQSSQPINTLTITNILGQTIYTQPPTTGNTSFAINVSTFPSGIYVAKINNTEVRKFIKE